MWEKLKLKIEIPFKMDLIIFDEKINEWIA